MAEFPVPTLKQRVNTYIKENRKQEITGPVLQGILHDIIDSLNTLIATSGKIIQYAQNLNAGATNITVGAVTDKIIVIGRYTAESATRFQSGRIVLSIKGTDVYVIEADTLDNNNGEGIGLAFSAAISGNNVNLSLTNTSGEVLTFTYSLFQGDTSLQGTGVTSINGLTGDVILNKTPVNLLDFPANGAISLGDSDGLGYNSKTVNAPLTITVAAGAIEGGTSYGVIVADGINVPNVEAFGNWDSIDYVNTAGVQNHWCALRKNGVNYFKWHQLP